MSKCFECNSPRVAEINAKCTDGCRIYIGDEIFHDGDIPTDMNIGGPDELVFSICLACGLLQDDFPLEPTSLESEHEDSDD